MSAKEYGTLGYFIKMSDGTMGVITCGHVATITGGVMESTRYVILLELCGAIHYDVVKNKLLVRFYIICRVIVSVVVICIYYSN